MEVKEHLEVQDKNIEVKEENLVKEEQLEVKKEQSEVKKDQLEVKLTEDVNIKDEKKEVIELKSTFEQEIIVETEIKDENVLVPKAVFQEPQIEENIKKNVYEDLEIPDTMEVIQVTEEVSQVTEVLSPKIIDEPIVEDANPSSPPITQDIVPDEIKPKSPSPVSTMTCSIDGNTDTEWNVPVAPATGTIKINISQKFTPVVKPIVTSEVPPSIELPQSPPDFTPTFGEIDPDQPPPPGLEMETVIAPKIQREMKPRLMNNAKKLKDYPIVNKGKEMSGLCSIM